MVKTAILVSGGGTNLQAIIDAHKLGKIPGCELSAVISSSPDAYAIKRAEAADIPVCVLDVRGYPSRAEYSAAILTKLKNLNIELVVLAGFMYILAQPLLGEYQNRIINIHPALIPSFCGDGCYGLHVHRKALEYGVKISGATAHFVTEDCDAGPIILQSAVNIAEDDTPETLQQRIMREAEWKILSEAIALYCSGKLSVDGRIVRISEK